MAHTFALGVVLFALLGLLATLLRQRQCLGHVDLEVLVLGVGCRAQAIMRLLPDQLAAGRPVLRGRRPRPFAVKP